MKAKLLFHPYSPGMKIPVVRNWLQQLIYPSDFATIGEVIRWYKFESLGIDKILKEYVFN